MAYQWTVIVLDLAAGGVEQDVSAFWDATASSFQPIAHFRPQQSRWRLSFPATTPALNIREGFPYMAGYRDAASRQWDATRPVYCGTIGKQTGGAAGARHILTADLDDWSVAFDDSALIAWPDGNFSTAYPPGFTVGNWLTGSSPYLGLLPSVFDDHKMDFSGVDFNLAFVPLTDEWLPCAGLATHPGQFQGCTLRDALDALMLAIRYSTPGANPVYWLQPIVAPWDPTLVIPQFRLIDRNGILGTVAATFSTNPAAGEWPIEQPFTHERDMRPAKQRIIVIADAVLGTHGQIVVDYSDPDHLAAYPTWLQRSDAPGRALIINDTRVENIAAGLALARSAEALIYGPLGRITFRTTRPTVPGELVELVIPEEGQDHTRYVVADVTSIPNVGRPLYELTLGAPAPDMRQLVDTLVRGDVNRLPLTAGGTLSLGLETQRLPQAQGRIDRRPSSYAQNAIQSRWRNVAALTVAGTDNVRPGQDPISTIWEPTFQAAGADAIRRGWYDKNGVHHPIGARMQFTSATTKYFNAEADYVAMDALPAEQSGTGSETLTFTKNGSAIGAPFAGHKGDRIGVVASFVTPTTPFAVLVRERDQALVVPS